MNAETPVEWRIKLPGSGGSGRRRSQKLLLVGARFRQPWIEQSRIDTSEIHFEGDLAQALADLLVAARNTSGVAGFALPIARLRASILAHVPGVISLDRDLGVVRADQPRRSALTLNSWAEGASDALPGSIAGCIRRWYHDALDGWAERHASAGLAQRVLAAAEAANVRIVPSERSLITKNRVDYPLIVRQVAERLVGEELFNGLGPCELVIDALARDPGRSNSIELMTAPVRLGGREESFSMVARLTAVTVPYSNNILLRISATKRAWASQVPRAKRNAPFAVRAYVMGPERPIFTVSVSRTPAHGWQLGDDYAEWIRAADGSLPKSLMDAVAVRTPEVSGWWTGLPLLTTLFDAVPQRTVFEGDEVELGEAVMRRLPDLLHAEIPFRSVPLPRQRATSDLAMLKVSDLGLVGRALSESEDEDESTEEDLDVDSGSETSEEKRRATLQRYREQNIRALKAIHSDQRPALWSFCSTDDERTLIERSVEHLFGDAVQLHTELLPANTHGLRDKLPGSTLKARERFDLRVQAWRPAAEAVKAGPAPRYVLICVSDRDNGRTEDPVNYYAGLHAMCQLGDANIHHVLPIAAGDPAKAKQNFVHRLQSALLDVFFAHSGVVFGAGEFLSSLFGDRTPTYIYGIQATRSQARAYSGEIGVSFLMFTRLHVRRGTTDVCFVFREKRTTERTKWMALNEGLRWLGSQRALDSDEIWLREATAREVRDFLGALKQTDPRAFVLIDWSTIASLWKGLSDDDLTKAGIARIDGKDIAAACPQMTLVRLRKGEYSIALRAQNTSMFERSGQRQEFGGHGETPEIYTEIYATTTKALVALGGSATSDVNTRQCGHYIQSMSYRNTVQILRGQSCYRTTHRMRRRKETRHAFELGVVEPSSQDAALPAPLEVTVMACPSDISPDNVAIAILGLRLGYVHYNDWTALPAPLFFKRKIDDYIIRYRSPATAGADDETEDESAVLPTPSSSESVEPEGVEPVQSSVDAAQLYTLPQSDYLLQTVQEVVAKETGDAHASSLPSEGNEAAVVKDATEESSGVAPATVQLSDDELSAAADASDIEDARLLDIVKALANENFALCGQRADFNRRRLYKSMLRGHLRVQVAVPYFVTGNSIFGDRSPGDKEALRRFWREQRDIGWVGPGETMPSLAKLGAWMLRRLQIPQGGYSIYRATLFPVGSLFRPVREGWQRYVAERQATASEDDLEVKELSETSFRLDILTQWAVACRDDELIAWLVFGSAHFPFDSVLNRVIPFVSAPLGEATREALHYFLSCVRASRAVLSGLARTQPGGLIYSARPRPTSAQPTNTTLTVQAVAPTDHVASTSIVSIEPASIAVLDERSISEPTAAMPLVVATAQEAGPKCTAIETIQRLVPGVEEFESALDEVRRDLDALERSHRAIMRDREEAARTETDRIAAAERALAMRLAMWGEIRAQAVQLLVDMREALPDMQVFRAEPLTEVPESLEAAQRDLEDLRSHIDVAKRAQGEYETVDERATPRNMTPRDAARHRAQWQEALQRAHEMLEAALTELTARLRSSPLFLVATDPPAACDPEQLAVLASEAIGAEPVMPDLAFEPTSDSLQDAVSPSLSEPESVTNPSPVPSSASEERPSAIPALAISDVANDGESVNLPEVCEAVSDLFAEDLEESGQPPAMAGRQQAQVVLGLVKSRAYAAAATYTQALQIDSVGGGDDHAIVAAAAIETIRRLRSDASSEQAANSMLRARMHEGGLQMPSCDSLAASLGILAAGLGEMLFPNNEGSARWTYIDYLQPRFTEYPGLQAFIQRIGNLEGIYLAQEMLTAASIGARDAALNNVARMRERAKRWHADETLYRKWGATDYRNLHEALFRNEEYPIAKCLGLIARGEDEKLTETYREARKRLVRPLSTIEDLAKRIGRRRSFDGVARGHITGNIERTQQFIEEYLEAVRRASGLQAPVTASARTMLHALYEGLNGALSVVASVEFEHSPERMHKELALTALSELKRMFDCAKPSKVMTDAEQMLLLRLPLGVDLKPSLWPQTDTTGIVLPPVVEPLTAIEEIESLARRLSDAGEDSQAEAWLKNQLERACDDHLAHNRLLPARVIDQHLGRAVSRHSEHARCLGVLRTSLQHERQRVTHAMALGALTQAEASRMLRLIEELLQVGKQLGDPNGAPQSTPDFPHAAEALRRMVTQPLEARLAESKVAFFTELELYVEENASAPNLQTDIDRIRALANERSASSIRAARDMFSLLKDGALPKKVSAPTKTVADTFGEFVHDLRDMLSRHRPLVESLQRRLRDAPQANEPSWLAALDGTARLEAAAFLESWEKVCAGKSAQELEKPLTDFFKALQPIDPTLVMHSPVSNPHRTEFFLNNSPLAGLDRTTTGVFIPPMLGSGTQYVQGIVIRQTAPEAAIKHAIDERCQAGPSFLLSRGNWSLETRSTLGRHHPVLLIDDNLVAYAALHPQERFKRLMQVALLTFNGNPYDDYGRPVPPEMFFGRRPELRRLRQVKTAAVLYGGRRLGKSSLLDQLQRDAQGRTGEAVIYLTLDRADRALSEDHVLLAWNAIYRRLVQAQVLQKPKNEPTSSVAIRRWIEDEILAGRCKAKGLYLLIDEADEIMGRDLHQRGPFISGLQSLCESVRDKCAMRFVIAGLHNLTRMANDENSPLGKFEPIALKPFWSSEDIQRGIELIKIPLEALGFYFGAGKEDMPLRIMAVCNFYPAFIQLYCKRLVEHLYNRRDKSEPPTYITDADLDKVELDKEFLADIRSKFKLNLDLDKRYAAIALVLADQYYGDGAKALAASEVRNLCDLIAGRHFETTGPGAYESLLEEMETLTILERVGAKYTLRTPNVAMMLGDRESVGQQLETLGAEVPIQSRSRGEHRSAITPLNGARGQQTFPMPSAWVRQTFSAGALDGQGRLAEADRQLLIFVGNELSGLTDIARIKGEWQIGETASFDVSFYPSPQAARSTLVRSARTLANRPALARRLHCVASGAWTANDVPDYARLAATLGAASAQAASDQSAGAVTRLALIANPGRAYEVAKLLHVRQEAEMNWRVVSVPPWTDDALYFRLERMEKPDIYNREEARKALLTASCGFGGEIERLFQSRLEVEDALRAPESAAKNLAPDLDTFYRRIGLPAAIDAKELKNAEVLLRMLDGEVRTAEMTEEYRIECNVTASLLLFLQWMGLLQEAPGGKWHVPEIYMRLLS